MERLREFEYRAQKAAQRFQSLGYQPKRIPSNTLAAYYSKGLLHDQEGLPNTADWQKMLTAIQRPDATVPWVNLLPVSISAVHSMDLVGPFKDKHILSAPPGYLSNQLAAELLELYAMCLLRDVPLSEWSTSPQVAQVVANLNTAKVALGVPLEGGNITVNTLFRGHSTGDYIGPWYSQFLYLPYKFGLKVVDQKYPTYEAGSDRMITWETALSAQNGVITETKPAQIAPRYLITLRDGASYIHVDEPHQPFFTAAMILQTLKVPFRSQLASTKEANFIDLGKVDLYDLLGRATRISLLGAWYYKWAYLQLRPEAMAMQFDLAKRNGQPINPILNNPIVEDIYAENGNYLLPQVYPEGSPLHPAYPSGHATIAGALSVILKAFFDTSVMINAYEPNADGSELVQLSYQLRVEDEINKLASNCANLRNVAGIHYRSDFIQGIKLGEAIGIDLLQEHLGRYTRPISITINKYDGSQVTISN